VDTITSSLTSYGGGQMDVDGRRERVGCPAVPSRFEGSASPPSKTLPKISQAQCRLGIFASHAFLADGTTGRFDTSLIRRDGAGWSCPLAPRG